MSHGKMAEMAGRQMGLMDAALIELVLKFCRHHRSIWTLLKVLLRQTSGNGAGLVLATAVQPHSLMALANGCPLFIFV